MAECNLAFAADGGIDALADRIQAYSETLADSPDDPVPGLIGPANDDDYGDVRLQYLDALEHGTGGFTLHTGLADYDSNHHGHWGASCVPPWSPYADCKMIAHDLLEQVLDSVAQAAGGAVCARPLPT